MTGRDLLLPYKTSDREKWLQRPAKNVCMILFPAETLGRKTNHADSLGRKPFIAHKSLGRKPEIVNTLGGTKLTPGFRSDPFVIVYYL